MINFFSLPQLVTGAYKKLYEAVFRRSITNPEEFWGEAAEDLTWMKRWNKVIDDSKSPFTKWYSGTHFSHWPI